MKIENKEIACFLCLLLIAIIILHLNFVLPKAATSMYYGDEVLVIECARSFVQNGNLLIDHGQTEPVASCLWHPPAYIMLVSLFMYLFGENALSLRMVSIIFNILTIVLIYFITTTLLKDTKSKKWWGILAAAIYALNPLTIQSSVILDIDGGLLNFLMALFLFLYIKKKNYLILAIPLFFIFWSKFTGAIIIFSTLFLFLLINLKWKEIGKLVLLYFTTSMVFLCSFFIFCWFFNLDFIMPFHHSSFFIHFKSIIDSPIIWISRVLWISRIFVYFVTPFFCLLFLYSLFWLILKEEKKNEAILFGIIAVLIIIFFAITGSTGWNFPKYYVLSLPYMGVVICLMLAKEYKGVKFINKKLLLLALLTTILIAAYFLVFLKDPLIPEISGVAKTVSFSLAAGKMIPRFLMYAFVPLALSGALIYRLPKGKRVCYGLFYLSIIMFIYLNTIQICADYSTYNLYGNCGLSETLEFIKERRIKAENIATYSQVGYYTNFSEFLDIMFVYNDAKKFKEWVIDNKKIEYMIILEKDIERIGKENMDYFYLEKKICSYYIFKRK